MRSIQKCWDILFAFRYLFLKKQLSHNVDKTWDNFDDESFRSAFPDSIKHKKKARYYQNRSKLAEYYIPPDNLQYPITNIIK